MSQKNLKLPAILAEYTDITAENAVELTKRIFKEFKNNTPAIIKAKIPKLQEIILDTTKFTNKIPNCKFSTKIRYFIDERKEIITCRKCGKENLINLSLSGPYPIQHNQCHLIVLNIKDFQSNIYYKRCPEMFKELINEINKYPAGFTPRLKLSRLDILNWMKKELSFFIQEHSIKYMVYCIIHNITGYPICQNCNCHKIMANEKHFMGLYEGFHPYCSNYCAQTDAKTKQTIEKTLFKKYHKHVKSSQQIKSVKAKSIKTCHRVYGCSNGGASLQAQQKARKRYLYDGQYFHSKPELAFYIWLKDNNLKFQYHSNIYFEYESNGKISRYYPDFILDDGRIIEIKGIQFFENYDKTKQMILPYKYRHNLTKEKIEKLNNQYKAKYQCMIRNNVIILTNDEYQKYIDYVKQIYGPKFLDNLKTE